MKRLAPLALLVIAVLWASSVEAQPPRRDDDGGPSSMRGDRSGGPPGGGFGMRGGSGMMGGRGGGMMGGRGGGPPGSMMGGRGGGPPGGMMGGRPGGGFDRGGSGAPGQPPRGGSDQEAQERFARFEGMLRGFDANKDGVIDPREVPEDRRRFLGFIGERMGVDFSKPVAIEKLREKAAERFGGGSKKKKEPEPLVPGFGVPEEELTMLAFGEREPDAASTDGSSRSGGSGQTGGGQDSRANMITEMAMRRYDRDGNGVIEKNKGEWEGMRGDPSEYDRNRDGRIDRGEMMARVSGMMGGGDRGGDRGGGGGDQGKQPAGDGRKSYRALTAGERLPEGLPEWFGERDANADGQVSMAERFTSWSTTSAREFSRYDLNDDGLITPNECLVAMSNPDFAAPAATSSESTPAPAGEAKPEEKKESAGGEKPWWET